ncbi:MAG: FlgO family outer membrane protein [bacterium]
MPDCSEKRLRDRLYAYELGLLEDTERREMELHMLDCESCLQDLKRFRETVGLIRDDSDVRATVALLAEEHQTMPMPSRRRRFWRTALAPTSVLAVIVLLALLVKDWQFEFQPSLTAVAAENRIAVMPFSDIFKPDDTSRLGDMVTNLVITDLAQSRYFQVVSSRRILDLRRLVLLEQDSAALDNLDYHLAQRAGAQWMLWGTVARADSTLTITSELVEVATGAVAASLNITGTPSEDVFSLSDRLTALVKTNLSLPGGAAVEPDRRVADVTTNSPQAYRYYLDGADYLAANDRAEARRCFERAVALDSTLAMAYYYLAELKDRELIHRAVAHAQNTGRREQLYIQSRLAVVRNDIPKAISLLARLCEMFPDDKEAHYLLAYYTFNRYENEVAIEHLRQAIKIDPLYRNAYDFLVQAYNEVGDFEGALTAINEYIELVPGEAAPYGTRGYLYAAHGKLHEAIASYERALSLQPGDAHAIEQLGNLHLFQGNYQLADSIYVQLLSSERPVFQSRGRYCRALIPVHQGRFEAALSAFDRAIESDMVNSIYSQMGLSLFQKSRIYTQRGQHAAALEAMDRTLSVKRSRHPEDSTAFSQFDVLLMAEAGETARATEALKVLEAAMDKSERDRYAYWTALGALQMSQGDPEAAVASLEKAAKLTVDFPTHFLLARAYQQAGRLSQAVKAFETQLDSYSEWRLCWSIWSVKMHYYLGLAYEESNWPEQAAEQYEQFLDLWRDADPGNSEIDDARRRLHALGNS